MKQEKECCILTLRLKPEPWQVDIIEKRFRIMENIKNALINSELRRLANLQRTKAYKRILMQLVGSKDDEKRKLLEERKQLLRNAGFSEFGFIDHVTPMQKHFVEHFSAQVVHRAASDVWRAFQKVLFGNGKKVHFVKRGTLESIECKKVGNGMNFRDGKFEWNGGNCKNKIQLSIQVEAPKTPYEKDMLAKKVKYLRIVRRAVKSRNQYYLQICLEGKPVMKERQIEYGKRVGIDIGTSTVAIVSDKEVKLLELADKVKRNHDKKRMLQRKMERSKRVCNPGNYNQDGTIITGKKLRWILSKRYLMMWRKARELDRKNAAIRKYQHTCLANYVLSLGTEVYIETMNFAGLQRRAKETSINDNGRMKRKKRFGKSLGNRAPAMFVAILRQKLKCLTATTLHEVDTKVFKASQYNHMKDTFEKKALKDRWTRLCDSDEVQRDLYSAFLLMNSSSDLKHADKTLCEKNYSHFKKLHDEEMIRIMSEEKMHISSFGVA